MGVYAGLDISLDAVAICVVGETGEILWPGKVLGDPEAVKAALDRWRDGLVRVGLEAGATSEWIGGHLVDEGFPIVCLESRHVKVALRAMTVKTDRNDAQGIARWFRAVHLKSAAGQRLRTLTAARKAAVRALTGNEQVIRGLLRPLGLKIGAVTRVRFEARVRQLIGTDRLLLSIFEPLLRLHKSLRESLADLHRLVPRAVRADPICRRQSGEVDRVGRITKVGDGETRTALFEAANVILRPTTRWSSMKAWAMKIADRQGVRRAKVALARRMAVTLHRMWIDEQDFRWTVA
ncbi:IS110 family transposase [Mesorhizobium sp. 2RAF45]|uniref:IS110 family transposase n=1 Tax=Mesorhizobium sp. 2RAF45 TaxID=3233001 RepID=UPI003F98A4B4